jgi:hemerythrin-like metal-binding protein
MDLMQWTTQLDVGVPAMNNDHKRLIELMNRLHEQHGRSEPAAALRRTLEELAALTKAHFTREESYMESIHFPKLAIHRSLHAKLLGSLDGFHAEFVKTGTLGKEFFEFLRFWLNAHIRGVDMQYGKGAAAA